MLGVGFQAPVNFRFLVSNVLSFNSDQSLVFLNVNDPQPLPFCTFKIKYEGSLQQEKFEEYHWDLITLVLVFDMCHQLNRVGLSNCSSSSIRSAAGHITLLLSGSGTAQPPRSCHQALWIATHGQHMVLLEGVLTLCRSAVSVFYSPY